MHADTVIISSSIIEPDTQTLDVTLVAGKLAHSILLPSQVVTRGEFVYAHYDIPVDTVGAADGAFGYDAANKVCSDNDLDVLYLEDQVCSAVSRGPGLFFYNGSSRIWFGLTNTTLEAPGGVLSWLDEREHPSFLEDGVATFNWMPEGTCNGAGFVHMACYPKSESVQTVKNSKSECMTQFKSAPEGQGCETDIYFEGHNQFGCGTFLNYKFNTKACRESYLAYETNCDKIVKYSLLQYSPTPFKTIYRCTGTTRP
eukprot:gene22100-29157_t